MKIELKSVMKGYLSPLWSSEKLLLSLSNIGTRDIKENFETSGRNIGDQWKPLSDKTILMRRGGSSKPLIDTGVLFASVNKLVKRKEAYVSTNRMVNSENIAYKHNKGVGVPKREFMKFSRFAIEEMEATIKKDATNV